MQRNILKFEIPDKMVGLVIGKGTETLKGVALKSNTKIFVPQKGNGSTRVVEVVGQEMEQQIAKDLILELIDNYHNNRHKPDYGNDNRQSFQSQQQPYLENPYKQDSYESAPQYPGFNNNYAYQDYGDPS